MKPPILASARALRQLRHAWKCPSGKEKSDAEALAAAAFATHVGVPEAEGLVEPLADEIDLGAVDQLEAVGVHEDRNALAFEDLVSRQDGVCVVDDVGEA